MSNALYSDVEARAQRRRTRTREDAWQDLVQRSWRRAREASDPAEALRWLERAHRMMPQDGLIGAALAGAFLQGGALEAAGALFQANADRYGTAEAWVGVATCAHLLGDATRARAAVERALHAGVPAGSLRAVAEAVAPEGWCGLTVGGVVQSGRMRPVAVRMDGVAVVPASGGRLALPPDWRGAMLVEVVGPQGPMLGSPLPVRRFAGLEGFVEPASGGVVGWAWHPAEPGRAAVVEVAGPLGTLVVRAAVAAEGVMPDRPFDRPRRIALSAREVAAIGEPVAFRGPDGRHLLGSPLAPGIEIRAAGDPGRLGFAPVWADVTGPAPVAGPAALLAGSAALLAGSAAPGVDVVIPCYRGERETLACIDSVLGSVARGTRVVVVDDASPEAGLVAALERLARRRRIVLLRLPENRGFPGAANAGLRHAAGRDVVLLNSDTLVAPGWLERLRGAAYSAVDIGSVTPLSNDATIVSYPDPAGGNAVPDLEGTRALDTLAQRANGQTVVDVPVGVGFCLYLRRDCLERVGLLREDLFAQGYGEENDWCLRARHAGWRNVAATGVFVAHVGAASFGAARMHLIRRNTAILERLHPGYGALVARHVGADPLLPARRRMDGLRWAAGRTQGGAVVLVTHAGGGGVDRVTARRAAEATAAGQRAIVLRPRPSGPGVTGVQVLEQGGEPFPNLVFSMPGEMDRLVALLRGDRPAVVEIHHLLGHHADVVGLAARLGAELVSVVHDYSRFCLRIALVSVGHRYCGEPNVAGCEACIADLGSLLEDDAPVRVVIERSRAELAQAVRVIAPSRDAGARIARHFPGVRPTIVPWEADTGFPPVEPAAEHGVRRVVVVGAIGVEKGFEVLLACVRDARARALPLEFVVVGFTMDDERLMGAGPAFVTGEYREEEAAALIRAQQGQIALIPSVYPETWCLALGRVWDAGLGAVVFDLGAQAERVRRTGRGWVYPLGLPPAALNDVLLRLAPKPVPSQCPADFENSPSSRG